MSTCLGLSIEQNLIFLNRTPSNTLQRHWELDDAPEEFYQQTEGTPEYARRKEVRSPTPVCLREIDFSFKVWEHDPVRTTQLSSYVAAGLREAEAAVGAAQFQQLYLSQADPTVLKQIQSEISA